MPALLEPRTSVRSGFRSCCGKPKTQNTSGLTHGRAQGHAHGRAGQGGAQAGARGRARGGELVGKPKTLNTSGLTIARRGMRTGEQAKAVRKLERAGVRVAVSTLDVVDAGEAAALVATGRRGSRPSRACSTWPCTWTTACWPARCTHAPIAA